MSIRTAAVVASSLLLLAVFPKPGAAQAMVEAAGASSAASGSAGALKSLGDTINGTLGNLNDTLKTSTTTVVVVDTPASKPSKTAFVPKGPAAPKPTYEDPQQIQTGLAYDEMMRRFGPPSMKLTDGSTMSITYMTKAGSVQVECEN